MAGTDQSRSTYRGLLLMDPRITSVVASGNTTYSTSYTQAGEAYDTPVPAALTDDMVLQSSGTPEVAGQVFTITTQDAGFPGRDKSSFLWDRATDTASFGWEHPNVATDWEAIVWTDGGTYPNNFGEPDAVTLSDGTIIICATCDTSSGVSSVVTYTRDPITCVWGSQVVIESGGTPYAHPCMVALPDDRVLIFYWVRDTGTASRSVRAYVSTDSGASWGIHSRFTGFVLADATYFWNTHVGRLRACYLNGDIALFGWVEDVTPTQILFQWASSDLGASFSEVQSTSAAGMMYPDCAVVDSTIVLGVLEMSGDQGIQVMRLGSAFQPYTSTEIINIDPDTGDDFGGTGSNPTGDLTIWADENGDLYAANLIYAGANKEGLLWRSFDAGETWEHVGTSELGQLFGTFWRTEDSTPSYPTAFVGTHYRGSQVLIHQWVAPVGNEDLSLGALWLGGYSTVTHPFTVSWKHHSAQVGWDEMWLPFELPSDVNVWTKTATGSEALTSGALVITTTAQTNYYTATPASSVAQGLVVEWELQCSIGGSTSSEFVAMRAAWGDGTHGYGVSVRMSTTGFRAYDYFGAVALGAGVTSVDLQTKWVQFRLYVAGANGDDTVGQYALYYRVNDKPGAPRAWTLAVSGVNLTDNGSTTDQIRWGHLSNTTSITRWRHVYWTDGSNTGRIYDHALSGGQVSPTDLNGRDYAPVSISVANGLKLRAVDGPTFYGSEWTISSRYEYAIEKILPSVEPSPTEGWRSTVDLVTQKIDFELSSHGDTEPLNDTIGLYLSGINWPVGVLQKWDGGSWSNLSGFDVRSDTGLLSLAYINNDGAIRPGTASAAGSFYFGFNELAGGYIRFETGTPKVRKIIGNTEGFWQGSGGSPPGTTKQVTIWYEDADGTEASSGTDLSIIPPQVLLFVHLKGINYRAYRLQISGTYGTVEGYYKLDKLVVGPVVIFGKDSDWGRKYGLEPQTTIIENANGNRRSRKMNRPRRSVVLPWTDGIDLTQVQGATAASTADYLKGTTSSGGIPVALRNDTALQLEGVLDYTGGGHIPVVYCPRITKGSDSGSANTPIFVNRSLSMYGRIVSDWAAEVVVGDEWTSEVVRVPGITLEEER